MKRKLEKLRRELDEVDAQVVAALAARQALVGRIGDLKLAGTAGLRDLQREERLLGRVVELGRAAGLDEHFVTRVFREILEHSLRRQQERLADGQDARDRPGQPLLVGFQGSAGAYSHLAATRHFSTRAADVRFHGFDSFREMLEAVRAGDIAYALLPIENTTAGSINEAYDLLAEMDLALVGEEVQEVEHCLLAREPRPLSRIRRIYSHPQALQQCSEFLRSLKNCHVESFVDTALAAEKIRHAQSPSQAAIASAAAARRFGLYIIRRDIANQKENYTRFVVVARAPLRFDLRIPCKTSVIFATQHEEGALLACLNILAQHHLNLTKLESRPRPHAPWEYLFYVDFEGNLNDQRVEHALRALASKTGLLKVLGSYPARTTKDARPAEPRPSADA